MISVVAWEYLFIDKVLKDFLKKIWFVSGLLDRSFVISFELIAVADLKHSDPP